MLTPDWEQRALRLQADGHFRRASLPGELGLLYRPVVCQISRWDRLKGFVPLLRGFAELKRRARRRGARLSPRDRRRLELARLVLAGPEPGAVADDPEAREALAEVRAAYRELDGRTRRAVAVLSLPMGSRKRNALIVNALQRCALVVAQNSLREGFGLTAAEAMWKGAAVMGTGACGLRSQISDGVEGRLVSDPADPREIASVLGQMLGQPRKLEDWGRNGQRRVYEELLVFRQVAGWIEALAGLVR